MATAPDPPATGSAKLVANERGMRLSIVREGPPTKINVVGICGSLRTKSCNAGLLRHAVTVGVPAARLAAAQAQLKK